MRSTLDSARACRAEWRAAHEQALAATDDYRAADFTLRQIATFDGTIARLESLVGTVSLQGRWRACSLTLNMRSPSGVRAAAKAILADPGKSSGGLCDVELTVRALSTFKDGQSATPECFSETGSALQPC